MKTLAFLSRKGGVGKSTLAIHLGALAAEEGLRALLVDTDPQRSLADWARAREAAAPEVAAADARELRALKAVAAGDGVDLVVVDTRPSSEADGAEVARNADFVLVPARPSVLDLRAIAQTVDILRATKTRAAVVLNQCPQSRGFGTPMLTREARRGLATYGLPVAPVAITQRIALAHALTAGLAVSEFEPGGKAAGEVRRLWRWTREQLK